jgi:CRISPR-associated endonuclease/helicase Cas3
VVSIGGQEEQTVTSTISATPAASTLIARQDANGDPQLLLDHLTGVATKAAGFGRDFNAAAWARLAGLWHDLGKYRPGFQRYIRQFADAHCESSVTPVDKTHSGAGALWALQYFQDKDPYSGRIFAYLIASHHAGLYDWEELNARMHDSDTQRELTEALAAAPPALFDLGGTTLDMRGIGGGSAGFHLWLRMLFSCLVDADFLDTEYFMAQDKAQARQTFPPLAELKNSFDQHMHAIADKARTSGQLSPVNQLRASVLAQCRAKAALPKGVFSLTVPTGGGKTLSSMAFALEHAARHGQRRIIYAIPYTSIIEQTADVFRKIFGADNFVEHHSNAEADPDREDHRTRLACENWDAPLVVTTNVQLFESLFAARTSRCRKLHHLVDSIIVLDEVQLLPPDFLQPIIDVLKLLTTHYGVTLVLCTATQPALNSRTSFDPKRCFDGFDPQEIIDDPDALYCQLKRVKVNLPPDLKAPRDWDSLAADIGAHDCVLTIVNTKKSAYELWSRLPKGALHLSALMCGQHRSDLLKSIGVRLAAKRAGGDDAPLRVVSTQLIEAGVDVDFPVVYRALAGLDSIAQAAGRCNREGLLPGMGQVHVFVPPVQPPKGLLRKGADSCITVLHGQQADPLALPLFKQYFQHLYGVCNLDEKKIKEDLNVLCTEKRMAPKFRTVSEKFKLIDDRDSATLIVKYNGLQGDDKTIETLLGKVKSDGPQRWLMRKLQRYAVTLYQHDVLQMVAQGDVLELFPGLYVQAHDMLYHPVFGVNVDEMPGDPASFVS